jgi:hypothetical protein
MPDHFHVIVCFYFCSVEDAMLPTEEWRTKYVVSKQCQKSQVFGCDNVDLKAFPVEIQEVVLSVYNYECVFDVSL